MCNWGKSTIPKLDVPVPVPVVAELVVPLAAAPGLSLLARVLALNFSVLVAPRQRAKSIVDD